MRASSAKVVEAGSGAVGHQRNVGSSDRSSGITALPAWAATAPRRVRTICSTCSVSPLGRSVWLTHLDPGVDAIPAVGGDDDQGA